MQIALIGDLIIDEYRHGQCRRLNPESPAPLVTQTAVEQRWGGAGNVCRNLESLGLSVNFLHCNHTASKKIRVIADDVLICRVDQDEFADNHQFLRELTLHDFAQYDLVVLSDYNKGTLANCDQLVATIAQSGVRVIVDPKQAPEMYVGAWAIKPNQQEFTSWGWQLTHQDVRAFAEKYGFELVIITLGRQGVMYYYSGQVTTLPADSVPVSDITGAGDCFLAAFVYGLSQGQTVPEAIVTATRGATESVRHPGTYVLKERDLKRRVVFTNGCFDILHRGHIELLEQSRALGDYLIVAINSDRSVQRLKGSGRPRNNQWDRQRALAALKCVDQVLIFDEDTPLELIAQIQPDIITKGGDYTEDQVVGRELAQVTIIPLVAGYSTTKLLEGGK